MISSDTADANEDQRDAARVAKVADILHEHFDTVHVFVTKHNPGANGTTTNVSTGRGNYFARYGQIKCWLVRQDAETVNEARED